MTQLRDLETSFRNILGRQLRELVNRCAPGAEWEDRERISTLLEKMIDAWIKAEPESRPAVLSIWLQKINAQVAVTKAIKGIKAGKSLVVPSRLPRRTSGKAADTFGPKEESHGKLPFDLLQTNLGRIASASHQTSSCEVKSEKIAELLNLSKSKVDVIRRKLRGSGLDFSFFFNGETGGKSTFKRVAGSKSPRVD